MATIASSIGTASHAAQTGTLTAMSLGVTAIVGSGTNFDPEFTTADRLIINHAVAGLHSYDITAVTDDTHLTIAGGLVEATSGGETPYKQGSLRDYSTITLWEAALGGAGGGAGNDAVGECYNDSAFDEAVTINDATPDSILLTVETTQRHDGTEGTGARIVRTGGGDVITISADNVFVSWLEIDGNGQGMNNLFNVVLADRPMTYYSHMIVHDGSAGGNCGGMHVKPGYVTNCLVYNIASSGNDAFGIGYSSSTSVDIEIYNCTVHDITAAATKAAYGIALADQSDKKAINVIATDVTGGGTNKCYQQDAPSNAVLNNNLASDTTASGAGSLDSEASADLFVSNSAPYDLHLKSGANAIDAGTDLGTTPSGVEIDVDGRDRDAEGDTWDMGAHEYVAVGGANAPTGTLYGPLYGPLAGPI